MSKYLSDINANKTFKNILRGNIDQGVDTNLVIPFREDSKYFIKSSSRKMDLHNQSLNNINLNESTITRKYENNYLKGQLKTNVSFFTAPIEPLSSRNHKVKFEDDNYNPILKTNGNKSEANLFRSKGDKIINDLFKRNPIKILDKSQRDEMNNDTRKNIKNKTDRVSDYLGSSGIKSAFNFTGSDVKNDKITNCNKDTLMNSVINKEPMKYKTNAAHVFDGKHGYYL